LRRALPNRLRAAAPADVDEALEDALYDRQALRDFVNVDLSVYWHRMPT
jgi:hypothetical protein